MPTQTRASDPSFLKVSPQGCPPFPPCRCSDSKVPETWDYGFNRLVTFPESPPVGAGILAITIFFLIVFFSNVLLDQVSVATLGIVVTLGTIGLLALLVLILFIV
ncbi:MAG: hypothetical protein P4L59_19510 [Desulfosporosinus sp.]|nr:hypothetical protein [Desulfosporosinus sp.]